MFNQIREDIRCVFDRDPAARNSFEVLTTYPGVHAILFHRLAHGMWKMGLRWLARPERDVRVSGKSGISQARSRLGEAPIRALYRQVVAPIARPQSKGAWYRGWRLVSIDGSTWEVADTPENAAAFGRPGASRGKSAYPQLRFVSLAETHCCPGKFGAGSNFPMVAAPYSKFTREKLGFGSPLIRRSRQRAFATFSLQGRRV